MGNKASKSVKDIFKDRNSNLELGTSKFNIRG